MTIIKMLFCTLITCSIVVATVSCNGSTDDPAASESGEPKDTPVSAAPKATEFSTFEVMTIAHTVTDFNKWKPFFDADSVNRRANGLEDMSVGRNLDNPNQVLIALKVTNPEIAKAFTADPKLKEVMEKAGVVSKPAFEMYRVVRYNPDSREKNRVVITHKVRDFDAWLKVFDHEGAAQRQREGMIDVVLARATDDPNNVQIVLDITDLEKAKTALFSDSKKQLMKSAGVEGMPRIEFFTSVN